MPNTREYKDGLIEQLAEESPVCVGTAEGDVVAGDVLTRARDAIQAAWQRRRSRAGEVAGLPLYERVAQ